MNPIGTIFVSKSRGLSIGTGSIDDPLLTISAGITLAESNATTDGHPWGVTVLPSVYDEQIVPSVDTTHIIFMGGAILRYSGTGAAISDANADIHITLHEGANLSNVNGGDLFELTTNECSLFGDGGMVTEGAGRLFNINGGTLFCSGLDLFSDSNTSSLVEISGSSEVRFVDCLFYQSAGVSAIIKGGGLLNLSKCLIQTAHTDYISAPSAQTVQVFGCVSNVAMGVNITETVQSMYVDPSFAL